VTEGVTDSDILGVTDGVTLGVTDGAMIPKPVNLNAFLLPKKVDLINVFKFLSAIIQHYYL